MATSSQDLVFRFLGIDAGAGRQFERMGAKADATAASWSKFGKAAAIAGAVVAAEGIKMAVKFQSQMELIHTQAGASQAEVQKMSKAVLSLAGPTATAPEELAKGLYHLESTGLRGAKALDALKIAAEGAKMGGSNLEDTTNALNAVISSGIKGASNLNGAMGMLNATVGSGDMRMQDLADAMGTGVLVQARNMGVSLQEVGAALAVFGDNNVRGANAATQLRMSMNFLSVATPKADQALSKIGLTSEKLSNDLASGGLNKAITDLHDHFQAAGISGSRTGQIIVEAFGKKAGIGISTLNTEFDKFQQKLHLVQADSNTFGQSWTDYTHTAQYNWDSFRASIQALVTEIGVALLPAFTDFVKMLNRDVVPTMGAVFGFFDKHTGLLKGILALVAAWKVYAAVTKSAALSNLFLGRTAVTAAGEETTLAASAARARAAGGFGLLGAGTALTLLGPSMVGAQADMHTPTSAAMNAQTSTQLMNAILQAKGMKVMQQAFAELQKMPGVKFDNSTASLSATKAQLDAIRQKYLGTASAAHTAASATNTDTAAMHHNAASADVLKKAINAATSAIQTSATASMTASGSYDAFRKGLNDLRQAVKGNGRELAGFSDKAIANRDALRTLGQGILQHVSDMQAQGASASKVNSTLQAMERQLIATATKTYGNANAVKALMAKWDLLPSQAKQALSGMYAVGSGVGQSLDDGLLYGMAFKQKLVEAQAAKLGRLAGMAVKAGAQVHSPSKLTLYVGRMLAEGLIGGFTGEAGRLKNMLGTAVENALNALTSRVLSILAKQKAAVKSAQNQLHADIQARNQARSSLASSLSGAADISGAFTTDALGNTVLGNVGQFVSSQVGPLKQFAHDLKWASQHHLAPVLLAQIANMGAAQGDQILQQLMQGGTSVAALNSSEALIQRYSRQAAAAAVDPAYAGRLARDRKDIREQTHHLAEIERTLQRIERKAAMTIAQHLTIEVKNGKIANLTVEETRALLKALRKLEKSGMHL